MPRSKPSRKCPGPNGRCYMCYSRDYRPEEKLTIWDAIVLGCAKSVEIIVTKGSKKGALANNKNSKDGETPLCKAAESGRVDILQVLIKLGADVNKTATYENMTPLHFAAKGGNPAAVEILVSHGANIEARTKEERFGFHTPLHTAALGCLMGACGHLCGHLETVQKLVELGAKFKAKTNGWNTACDLAYQGFNYEIVNFLNEVYDSQEQKEDEETDSDESL